MKLSTSSSDSLFDRVIPFIALIVAANVMLRVLMWLLVMLLI